MKKSFVASRTGASALKRSALRSASSLGSRPCALAASATGSPCSSVPVEEEHVLAALAVVARHHVGGDRRVRVPQMRGRVDVVDRRGDVEGALGGHGHRTLQGASRATCGASAARQPGALALAAGTAAVAARRRRRRRTRPPTGSAGGHERERRIGRPRQSARRGGGRRRRRREGARPRRRARRSARARAQRRGAGPRRGGAGCVVRQQGERVEVAAAVGGAARAQAQATRRAERAERLRRARRASPARTASRPSPR